MATLFRALVFQSDSEENTNISYIPKTDLREGYQVLTLDFQHPCFQCIDHVFLCLCPAHKVLFQCIIVSLCHIYIVYHNPSCHFSPAPAMEILSAFIVVGFFFISYKEKFGPISFHLVMVYVYILIYLS